MNKQSQNPIKEQQIIKGPVMQGKQKEEKQEYFTISWAPADQPPPQSNVLGNIKSDQKNNQTSKYAEISSIYDKIFCQDKVKDIHNEISQNQPTNLAPKQHPSNYPPTQTQQNSQFYQKQYLPSQIRQQQKPNVIPDYSYEAPLFYGQPQNPTYYNDRNPNYSFQSNHLSQFSHLQRPNSNLSININRNAATNQAENSNLKRKNEDIIKLNIRSQLIRRSRKYQISTNNAHKKYINCLKNLFYEALSQQQISEFEKKYIKQKSSRVFFFIILVYVKYRFSPQLGLAVKLGFEKQMNERIKEYEQQIYRCSDFMLKNYRYEEIHQIEIALKAIEEFYTGNTSYAIEYLYRKDKHIIVKQNHFRTSLKIIQDLQTQYSAVKEPKIYLPYYKNHYHRKMRYRPVQKDEQPIHQHGLQYPLMQQGIQKQELPQHEQNEQIDHSSIEQEPGSQSMSKESQISKNDQVNDKVDVIGSVPDDILQKNFLVEEKPHEQSIQHQLPSNFQSELAPQDLQQMQSSKHPQTKNQGPFNPITEPYRFQQQKNHQIMEQTLFPPIPPFFYRPDFDQKYGYLFRKLAYIKNWRQTSQNQTLNQQFANKRFNNQNGRNGVPSPLVFGSEIFMPIKRI